MTPLARLAGVVVAVVAAAGVAVGGIGPAPARAEVSPGPTPTASGAASPTPLPTGTPTAAPTPATPTPTPTPTGPSATPSPTPSPTPTPTPTPPPVLASPLLLGTSVEGRQIVAVRQGDPYASRILVVLGQMHGNEPAGRRVVAKLRKTTPPTGTQVWTITSMNPDGAARGTRRNARGVDLNRNFPYGWSRFHTSALYNPGPSAASERETVAVLAFLTRLRPDAVLSFHQAFNAVDLSSPKTRRYAGLLARWIGLRTVQVPCRGPCSGTMTSWLNATQPGMAITVELPHAVPDALVARAAAACLRLIPLVPNRS